MKEKLRFFEKILQEYENDNTITLTQLTKNPACKDGDNFSSTVSRVHVFGKRIAKNGDQIEFETSVIVKVLLLTDILKRYFTIENAFNNEVHAFKNIIPALKEYAPGYKLPLPDCLYANDKLIVLQDLALQGYINSGRPTEFTVELCKQILKVLAHLHAASISLQQKNPEKFQLCVQPLQEILFPEGDAEIGNLHKNHFDIAIKILKETEHSSSRDKIIQYLERLKLSAFATQRDLLKQPWKITAITHGDVWAKNVLFSKTETRLIDFQITRYTSVAADLSYTLYVNLNPQVRRNNLNALLQFYLNELMEALSDMDADVSKHITLEVLMEEMQAFKAFGFMSKLWILPVYYFDPKQLHGVEFFDTGLDVANIMSKIDDTYKNALLELVYDFVLDENNL